MANISVEPIIGHLRPYARELVFRYLSESEIKARLKEHTEKLLGHAIDEDTAEAIYQQTAAPLRRSFRLAAEVGSRSVERPKFIVKPLVPRGRLGLLVGDSTEGKTPFTHQLARDIAAGKDFLDYFPCDRPYRVGLVDAESTEEDVKLRLGMQSKRPADFGDRLLIWDGEMAARNGFNLTGKGIAALHDAVTDHRLDVLMLDNVFSLSGGQDVSKQHVVQPILAGLRRITELAQRPGVLLVHHPRKGGRDDRRPSILEPDFTRWLEEESGSYLWVNLTDVRLGIERVEVHGEEVTVFRGRTRVPGAAQEIGPLYLAVDEDAALAAIDRRPQLLEQAGEKMQQALTEFRRMGKFTLAQADQAAARLDISKKTVRRAP